MANFCIPKFAVEKLKTSALKGEVNVKNLYAMSSAERNAFFTKYTDKGLGKLINVEFEKAMVSSQKDAFTSWAKSVFTPIARSKPAYKTIIGKINQLDELGVLNPESEKAFLADLVADKLGVSVSAEEVKIIKERADKIDAAQEVLGENLGNPTYKKENIDFFMAKKSMDDYLEGLNPAPKLRVFTGTIGRGMMLFSLKSPILNIGSNIEIGVSETVVRRISNANVKGTSAKKAIEYVKFATYLYQKTGYDISRMVTLSDTGASGVRVLGETVHTQGPGVVRKIGRGVESLVFKQLMGAPDSIFSAAHFADSVNLNSHKVGKTQAEREAIMEDAMRIEPQTVAGEVIRAQGILDAQVATWTNKSWASEFSEGTRKVLNDLSGDLRVGDYVLPFIKTASNVVSTGLDYGGFGVLKAFKDTVQSTRKGTLKDKQYLQTTARNLTRSGFGLIGAMILASVLDDDDFIGAWDPARQQFEELRNSNNNSIRIWGKWISTDWLGPFMIPVTGMMYARKYGRTGPEQAAQYFKGVASGVEQLPVIEYVTGIVKDAERSKRQTPGETAGETQDYILSELSSRLIPSIVGDVARATDPYERKAGKGTESVQAKIPGLRQRLPIKRNIFGEDIRAEGGVSRLAFGSRVKTDRTDSLLAEMDRVQVATDKNINFTNWDKSSSVVLEAFKKKVGAETYNKATIEYGRELKKGLTRLINDGRYKSLSDNDKLSLIQERDTKAQEIIFRRYSFQYKPVRKTKTGL